MPYGVKKSRGRQRTYADGEAARDFQRQQQQKQLRPYQNRACWHLYRAKRMALYAGLGSGKTIIILYVLQRLLTEGKIKKVLLVGPIAVVKSVWEQEARDWPRTAGLRFSLVLGNPKQREVALAANADIYLINYENITWLLNKTNFEADCLVLDESSMMKSYLSVRFRGKAGVQGLKHVCDQFEYVYEISATPKPAGYEDLWPQIYLLDQGFRLGKNISAFRKRWYFQYGRESWMWKIKGPEAEQEIRNEIADICYRISDKEVAAVLPDTQEITHTVDFAPKVRKDYKFIEDEFFLDIGDAEITVNNAATMSGKLQQFCNGAVYTDDEQVQPVHDEKLQMLDALIEDLGGENVLIIYSFRHDLERLQSWRNAPVLSNKLSTTKFNQLRDEWNAGQHQIMYGHPRSMGHGLNLQQGGHHIIFFGLPWSLEGYQQTIGRLARSGQQQSTVFVHHIVVSDTIETEVMLPRLRQRDASQHALLEFLARWRAKRS